MPAAAIDLVTASISLYNIVSLIADEDIIEFCPDNALDIGYLVGTVFSFDAL